MVAKSIATNRRAGFDVAVEEEYEAGLLLRSDEIKSVRAGRLQLNGAYVKLMRGRREDSPQVPVLVGLHLSLATDPERSKPLLLHTREVESLRQSLQARGRVAVPLSIYFKNGWAKVRIGVGTGRKQFDKRRLIQERDIDREQRRQSRGK